ncbi:hypothetical protein E3P99_03657 [Wallemia hederae]|uniref:Mitochondrial import inner membrane translocase subunit TIM50 n=1 Tax=Wallemia hederae TaxID=1540922 RepID=A0A4T0FF38_9BASI|nr:hypothetical protein E3P99_03657 [Wallemia hederae]
MRPPPTPTASYVEACKKTSSTIAKNGINQHLLVLDLNGTLISTKSRNSTRRPQLERLQRYMFKEFQVMVYSSAMRHNVQRYVDTSFSTAHRNALLSVLSRECMDMSRKEFTNKVQTYKNLSLVWKKHPQFSQYNTILIDDSSDKAANQPHNLLQLSTWDGSQDDTMLIALIGVLDDIKNAHNVSHYLSTFQHIKCVDEAADTATPWFEIPQVYSYWLSKGHALLNIDGVLDNMASLSLE